jgi:hypothetical protein
MAAAVRVEPVARAAAGPAGGRRPAATETGPPTVSVRIGRVEVRTTGPQRPAPPPPARPPAPRSRADVEATRRHLDRILY